MTAAASRLVLVVPMALTILSFFNLLPTADPLSSVVSESRIYTLGLQGAALMLVVAIALRRRRWPPRVPPSVVILALFGFLALASAAWSPSFELTAAKSLQLLLLVFTAVLIGANLRGVGWRETASLMGLASLLVLLVLLFANTLLYGNPFPLSGGPGRQRLVLAYAHPLTTGGLTAIGLLALLNARLDLRLKLASLAALAAVLVLTNARGATAFVSGYVVARALFRLSLFPRAFAAAALVVSMVVAGTLLADQLVTLANDQMMHGDLATLNGRIPLWTYALATFERSPVVGHGYYASRFLLIPAFPWAGQAHSSFVEILLTTGVLGFALLLTFCMYLVALCVKTKDPLLMAIALFAVTDSVLNPGLFDPGLVQFSLLVALTRAEFSIKWAPVTYGLADRIRDA